jgi:hypothetical protein
LFAHLTGTHPQGCLTLYLPAGPAFDERYLRTQAKDLEHRLEERFGEQWRLERQREFGAVRRYLEAFEHRPTGIALAIFSSVPDGILDARRLPEDLDASAHFGTEFQLRQLHDQLQRHPPGLVLVTENEQARLFRVVLEDVHEIGDVRGRPIRSSARGRSSHTHEKRDLESKRLNVKQAIDALMKPALAKTAEVLYLAGPDEARSETRRELPARWRDRLAGELVMPLDLDAAQLAHELRARI